MKRLFVHSLLLMLVMLLSPTWAADTEENPSLEALKQFNEFIGGWKASGQQLKKTGTSSKDEWTEEINWGWRFKGEDAWMTMDIKKGRYFKSGELKFLPEKMKYELTLVDLKSKKQVFEGKLSKEGFLTLERFDKDAKETQQIQMNSAGDGVRFTYRFNRKPEGRTLFAKDYEVSSSKIGESLGNAAKKTECCVSGGLGVTAVAFGGKTYYVCCSGCKDAFDSNPEKFVKLYEAKKKAGN